MFGRRSTFDNPGTRVRCENRGPSGAVVNLVRVARRVLVLATQARSRRPRHASPQDLRLRDCPATVAPADNHLASSSQQLHRRPARGIWTAGEPIVKLLSFERPSWSRTGPARSARPDWPAAAPPRRRPADLLPASTRAPGDAIASSWLSTNSAVYRQSFSSAIPAHELPRPRQPIILLASSPYCPPSCATTSYLLSAERRYAG